MSNFYNYMNDDEDEDEEIVQFQPVKKSMRSSQDRTYDASNLINSTNNRIDQAKQSLYDKIDVCCAQYGLYGLQIIEQAITKSLSNMINGTSITPQRVMQQRTSSLQNRQDNYAETIQARTNAANYEEAMVNSFMDNLDAVMVNCDKEFDKKAEADMKQRLFEQKQYEMISANDKANSNVDMNTILTDHDNDFEVTAEEDLRSNV